MPENSNLERLFPLKPIFRLPFLLVILITLITGGINIYTGQEIKNNARVAKEEAALVVQVTTVTALGRLEPNGEIIKLSAPTSAEGSRVEKLLVREGTQVKQGQLIAILDSRDRLTAALAEAHEEVRVTRANLNKIKAGAKKGEIDAQKAAIARLQAEQGTEIEAQQATIARLEAEKNNAQAEYQRYQKLYRLGAIAISLLDTKGLTLATAQQQQAEAKANYRRIQASGEQQLNEARATLDKIAEVRSVDVAAAQAEVNRAIAAVKKVEANLRQAFVRSPQEGEVFKIHTRPGELVSDDGILEMGQNAQMYAVAEVYQSDINKVRLGQRVQLLSDSVAGELLGIVDRIDSEVLRQNVINSDPTSNIDSRIVEVHIRLDQPSSKKAAKFSNLQVKAVIQL